MAAAPRPHTSAQIAMDRLRDIGGGRNCLAFEPSTLEEGVVARRRIGPVPLMQEEVVIIDDEAEAAKPKALVVTPAPETVLDPAEPPAPAAPSRLRWSRNVVLGASLSFADAGIVALRPVRFVWQHMHTVGLAAIYFMLPMVASLSLLSMSPTLAAYCKAGSVTGTLYLLGLYLSSAALLMLAAFSGSFFWRGSVRLMDHFARRGEEAFPKG